ncbi:hypothetical protein Q9Q99_17420 [Curtobacterium flaccumfaciens]|nr:hypothetical protein Q9Q99_17420 [Curtobacterium flaccumfaciens]
MGDGPERRQHDRRRLEGRDRQQGRRERLPHLLRLGHQGRCRRPGRDRLEQRPGPGAVHRGQGGVLPDDHHHRDQLVQGHQGRRRLRVRPAAHRPPGATERPSDGIEAASILSGDNWVVADYGTKQKLSFAFVKQLSAPKAQLEYYDLFGNLPTNASAAADLAADNPQLKPIIDAGRLSKPTAFTGAWSDIQLALVDVVVQSIPSLKSGEVTDDQLRKRLQDAQKDAQATLDRQKNGGL